MYVRAAKNRDELWLLENIESLGVDETAFRSRDYVIAVDEETNRKAGFGRIRIHNRGGEEYCELTSLGIIGEWRGQGVGAHIIERLVEKASDQNFETIYAFVENTTYFERFGFREVAETELPGILQDRLAEKRAEITAEAVSMQLSIESFMMPRDLREAFKQAGEEPRQDSEPQEQPEDFGIDPDTATYKYDTGT